MRSRIGVEHLQSPISYSDVEQALANAQVAVNDLSQLPANWLSFCQEKLTIASESLGFLIRQRIQIYKRGYPSNELDYLKLIERQVNELKPVYLSFYHLAPGLIHQLRDQEPEIYTWLMLHSELGGDLDNLLCGLSVVDSLEMNTAMVLVAQSSLEQMDSVLCELIEGQSQAAPFYFECLRIRQTLSNGLIKRWHKAGTIAANIAFPLLALQDVKEGIEWLDLDANANVNASAEQYLFERLITKYDRRTWFRQLFGSDPSDLPSNNTFTFAKLLELKEFEVLDFSSSLAPVDFVLSGDWQSTPAVIEQLQTLDEHDGEIWIHALYVVYGNQLPLTPQQVGIEYEWGTVITLLNAWIADESHVQEQPSRLGQVLSFESTLAAMQDSNVNMQFREWLWRQLCIQSRVYIPWHMAMPSHQQAWNFEKFKATPSASERFNLRNSNAVMGY